MSKRSDIVKRMESWVGAKQGDSTHRYIVDNYNSIKPLPNGYKLKYTDAWCAGTVSSAYQCEGAVNLIPASASCGDMVNRAIKMGIWQENDAYVPSPADIVMYDWQDDKKNYATTDDKGAPDHTGIVQKVDKDYIYVIEGNYGNQHKVAIRKLHINGLYIRGFITPKFGDSTNTASKQNKTGNEAKTKPSRRNLMFGCKGDDVKELHKVLRTYKYGVSADNDLFDMLTKSCVLHFQKSHGLVVDGIVGEKTYKALGM